MNVMATFMAPIPRVAYCAVGSSKPADLSGNYQHVITLKIMQVSAKNNFNLLSLRENRSGEEHDSIDTAELLGQHHHARDDEWHAKGSTGEHVLERHAGHKFHRLVLCSHVIQFIVDFDGSSEPGQSYKK